MDGGGGRVRGPQPPTLVLVVLAALLPARTVTADEPRIWLSAGGGAALGSLRWSTTAAWERYQEAAELEARYEAGLGPAFEAALGVRVLPRFGVRAAFGWSRRDTDAQFVARIPHPFYFERPRALDGEASGLEYRELASYLDLEWRPLMGRVELAVFGGVCLVRVESDLVGSVEYDEQYPYDEASFRQAVIGRVQSDAALGWSVGAAVSHALGARVRLAVETRYSQAQVELAPPDGEPAPVDAGGLKLIAALRVGF
jgi:hypothetical protein